MPKRQRGGVTGDETVFNDEDMWFTSRAFPKYECNRQGCTRNKDTKYVHKPHRDAKGYLTVGLVNNEGEQEKVRVNRLMGDVFLEDFDITNQEQTIDHINQRRDDNRLDNLRIATRKQQSENSTYPAQVPKNSYPIEQWTLDGQFVKRYESRQAASAALGVHHNTSFKYVDGEPRKVRGFIWRYPEPGPDLEGEIWEQIGAWVHVSNRGRVKKIIDGQVVYGPVDGSEAAQSPDGYAMAGTKLLHLEVARLFLPPSSDPGRTIINHKDGNKTNADVCNLERVTYSENTQHAYDTGLIVARPVIQLDLDGTELARYPSTSAAARSVPEAHQGNIWACASGKNKTCGGYRWKFTGDVARH